MSDVGIWDVAANSNQLAIPDGFPEGQSKPSLNNSSREVMAAAARMYRDLEWGDFWATPQSDGRTFVVSKVSDTVIRIVGDPATDETAYFSTNRRVKITSSGASVYGYVASTDYGTPPNNDITLVMEGSDVVPASPTGVFVYVLESIRKAAFQHVAPLAQGRHMASIHGSAITPMEDNGCEAVARYKTTGNNPEIIGPGFPDSVAATGAITFTDNPSDGEKIIINGTTWTFLTTGLGGDDTEIGASLADTLTQLVSDLNDSSDENVNDATYDEENATTLTIIHDTKGTGGNSFTIAPGTPPAEATYSGSTLLGGTSITYGTFQVEMPKSWDVATNEVQLELRVVRRTGPTAYNVVFKVDAIAIGDGDSMDADPSGSVQAFDTLSLTSLNTGYLTGELGTPITVAGSPTGDGEMVVFRIYRDPTEGADTMNGTAYIIGVRLYVPYAAANDA